MLILFYSSLADTHTLYIICMVCVIKELPGIVSNLFAKGSNVATAGAGGSSMNVAPGFMFDVNIFGAGVSGSESSGL